MLYRRSLIGLRLRLAVATAALGLVAALISYLVSPLNGNLRYEAGVKLSGTASAAATFSHRPLAFRLLMAAIFRAAHTLSIGTASFELLVRVAAAVMAVGAGAVLWLGLRARNVPQPGWHAAVAAAAVLLISPINTAEPDWMAAVLTMAGIGVVLVGRRRPWLWASLGALLFVGAAGMKIVTVLTAIVGLGVVALIDRRQALRAVASCALLGGLYVAAILRWVPWELQWLLDLRTVQKHPLAELPAALPFFAELAAYRPIFVLLPAALVLARLRERIAIITAVLAAAAAVIAQGQYFVYHAVPLVVVAAVAVFRAARDRISAPAGAAVLILAAASSLFTAVNGVWLADHQRLWGGALIAAAAAGVGWALAIRPQAPVRISRMSLLLAGLATLALLYPASTPYAARLVRPVDPDGTQPLSTLQLRAQDESVARRIHQVIGGPDVKVTYLTFGEWTYFIGNPTDCRYPSPLFLQRTATQTHTASYRDNLDCLRAENSVWLIWDPAWFRIDNKSAEVQTAVADVWDCAQAIPVDQLRICPRRA